MSVSGPIFVPEHVTILNEKMAEFFPNHTLLDKPQFIKINKKRPLLVDGMVEGPCNNTINPLYAEESFKKLKQKNIDILVMRDVSDMKAPIKIDAFILIEQGECGLLPSTYSVKLICSQYYLKATNGIGGGLFLLASFLYCLKHYFITNQISDQKAILELSRGYENIQGFITYTKLGFHKDLSLTGVVPPGTNKNTCLAGIMEKNLPMLTNLTRVQPNDFLDFLDKKIPYVKTAGLTQLYRHIDDDTGLFNLFRAYTPGQRGETAQTKTDQIDAQHSCAFKANVLALKKFSGMRTEIDQKDFEKCKVDYENLFDNARSYPIRYVQSFYQYSPRRKNVKKSVRKSVTKNKKSVRKSITKNKKSVRKTKK